MLKAFISYSHADAQTLNRLHVHMANLKRNGELVTWTDSEINAGSDVDQVISTALNEAEIFLAIVSPDYLNSRYCYEEEFETALKLHNEGKITIVPIIAQPCDWKNSPFKSMKAIPKDGKPISEWTNENNAFLNIIDELRQLLESNTTTATSKKQISNEAVRPTRNYKVKRDFDAVDILNFKESSFNIIKAYFKEAINEITGVEQIQARFISDEKNSFGCIISNRAKIGSVGYIHIGLPSENLFGRSDLAYSLSEKLNTQSFDKSYTIEYDDYQLYWTSKGGYYGQREQHSMTAKDIAEKLWTEFIEQVGISF